MSVPMFNEHPIELGIAGHEAEILRRFSTRGDRPWFAAAFPGDPQPVSLANVVRAIAAFERTLLSADSPFDRYLYRDDRTAITPQAIRGMKLFFSEEIGCSGCHAGFNLSGLGGVHEVAEADAHLQQHRFVRSRRQGGIPRR